MKAVISYLTKKNIGMILLIVVLSVMAYWPMLGGPFKTLDDHIFIVQNPDIKNLANIGKIFKIHSYGGPYYRPLTSFSYMLEYRCFGSNPFPYYIVNLIIHLATTISIFFLICSIFRNRLTGFFISLLFAIHPIHWEAVTSIAGRAIGLCAFLYINSFHLFYVSKTKTKSGLSYFFSLALFILALLSKESALSLPIMILSFTLFLNKDNKKNAVSSLAYVAPFFIVAILYVFVRTVFLHTNLFSLRPPGELLLGVGTFLRATITHIRLFVIPVGLYFDRATAVFERFNEPELLLSIFFFIALVTLLFKFANRLSKETLFFVSWFFIGLLPVSQIVPVKIQSGYISSAEHFLYLPSVGFFALTVLLFQWVYQRTIKKGFVSKKIFYSGIVGLYVFFLIMAFQQSIFASSEIALYKRTLRYNPENVRIRNSLGMVYAKKGMFKEAQKHFIKVLEVDSKNPVARINLGRALHYQGRYAESLKEYMKIKKVQNPDILRMNIKEAKDKLKQQRQKNTVK